MKKSTLLTALGAGVGLAATAAMAARRVASRSLPTIDGLLELPGLRDRVEVWRDTYGVPHIFARNTEDLFMAQGFVTAQDRLWQMDLNRRAASGRLAEFAGVAMQHMDLYMRTLHLRGLAEEDERLLDHETRGIIEAYAAGVNAYLDAHKNKLPLEFLILGYKPEPWTVVDTLAIGKLLGWMMTASLDSSVVAMRLAEELGEETARRLFPEFPKEIPVIVPGETYTTAATADDAVRRLLGARGNSIGSNNWVLRGEKTTTGMPLVCNDPHLMVEQPNRWYEIDLKSHDVENAGLSTPGIPGLIIGHNRHVAWAITSANAINSDLFVEQINPENPRQYRVGDRWEDMSVRHEMFHIKGRPPMTVDVFTTRHGPIVSHLFPGVQQAVALRWGGAVDHGHDARAFLKLNKAQNWNDFREALRDMNVPCLNFVYADMENNIGYRTSGHYPMRKSDGMFPVPGWDDSYEWEGFVPFEHMPEKFNPPEGFIATANNKLTDVDDPYYLAGMWERPYRIQRITQLLTEKEKYSPGDLRRIQMDDYSIVAANLTPLLLDAVARSTEPAVLEAAAYLRAWDYRMDKDSVAACIFEVWYQQWVMMALRHRVSPALAEQILNLRHWSLGNFPWSFVDGLLLDGVDWFQGVSAGEIAAHALEDSVDWLNQRLGDQMDDWRWGRLHKLTYKHPLGAVKPLNLLFNIGPFPLGFNATTVSVGEVYHDRPYDVGIYSTMRLLMDLQNFSRSRVALASGQSGHPLSPHYKDQVPLWLAGDMHPMWWKRDEIEQHAEGVLRLIPRAQVQKRQKAN